LTNCHYVKGRSGTIYPNGHGPKDAGDEVDGGCDWIDGTKNDSGNEPYSLSVFVRPYWVKIWKFPDGTIHTEAEYMTDSSSHIGDDATLKWLCTLVRMAPERHSSYKEIDYTPELGLMFKNMILFIIEINERIQELFGKEFDLSQLDVTKIPLLGFSGGGGDK
jgi:hypothetical protein